MKKIEEMDLYELDQFKNVVKGIVQEYDNILSTYGRLNNDLFLQHMPQAEQRQFAKKNEYTKLVNKVTAEIEKRLQFYEEN